MRRSSCACLHEAHNVIILRATGASKPYLACALGMDVNRSFYSVRYIRLPDLLVEITLRGPNRANGTYQDYYEKAQEG